MKPPKKHTGPTKGGASKKFGRPPNAGGGGFRGGPSMAAPPGPVGPASPVSAPVGPGGGGMPPGPGMGMGMPPGQMGGAPGGGQLDPKQILMAILMAQKNKPNPFGGG